MPSKDKHRNGTQPRISAKDQKFATVLIGRDEEKFIIHEELLTYHSDFFRAALTGTFKEAEEKSVRLKYEDTNTFEVFVHWLYHQRLPNEDDVNGIYQIWAGQSDNGEEIRNNLIYLYLFCEKYNVRELRIMTMTSLYDLLHDPAKDCPLPSAGNVRFVFENLRESSPLCDFLVDGQCYWGKKDAWSDFADG
ncbi:Nn.00g061420.m01.CDS01 [Neocucurbitaria sp. VM-36]